MPFIPRREADSLSALDEALEDLAAALEKFDQLLADTPVDTPFRDKQYEARMRRALALLRDAEDRTSSPTRKLH